MKNKIAVTCTGAATLDINDLDAFQGELKSLSVEDYNKLRALIIDLGFTDPVSVWKNGGKYKMLNGHQRVNVVRKMIREEGYECPPIPVNFIDAANVSEAKRKVLAMSSQFGKIESDGLYNFVNGVDWELGELSQDFKLPDFSLRDFVDGYIVDTLPTLDGGPATPSGALTTPLARAAGDTLSNMRQYGNETTALEGFLGSETRRLTIYMNPGHYDTMVKALSKIATANAFADYREVIMHLLEAYERNNKT